MVVTNNKRSILFVSIDAVGVTINVYHDLKKRLAHLNFSEIILTATHTHSGPGALSKSLVWEVMAMDRYKKEVYEGFINGIVESVEKAHALQTPATLHSATLKVPEIHKNRRGKPSHLDSEARMLLAKNTDGKIIGEFVNFAIHGCALGEDNLLFINGAERDVSREYFGADGIELTGSIFSEKAKPTLKSLKAIAPILGYSKFERKLDKARFNLKKCGAGKNEIKIPIPNKTLPRLASLADFYRRYLDHDLPRRTHHQHWSQRSRTSKKAWSPEPLALRSH